MSKRAGNFRTRSVNMQLRQVSRSIHQGQLCQPCILCKQGNQSKYFHPKSWKDKSLLEQLRKYEPSTDIKLDSCICRSCSNICDDSFVPRWRKLRNGEHAKCYVLGCQNAVHKVTKLVNKASLRNFFCTAEES